MCAQVNPSLAGDRAAMEDMARRFNAWAPNIAVKLPATSAGLDVMERLVADGITDDDHPELHRPPGARGRRRY